MDVRKTTSTTIAGAAAALALATPILFVRPVPLSAQVVRGQIVDGATQAPIPGAFIVLVDSTGAERGGVLSGSAGAFVLKAPRAGHYTLRAERIGYRNTVSDTLTLPAARIVPYRFEITTKAVDLEGMEVTSRQGKCKMSREMGAQTSALWDEIRKALSISAWEEEERGFPYQAALWTRTRDVKSQDIEGDTVTLVSGYGRTPFASESARSLGAKGYVRDLGTGGYMFYGLDAKTLLSDDFLGSHCFRVRRGKGEVEGLLGLSFEPLDKTGPTDVEGTLWMDPATSELRYLEFRYSKLSMAKGVSRDRFGGRVDFQRLDNGDWVVRHWWLRMPQSIPYRTEQQMRYAASRHYLRIHERGGELRFVGAARTAGSGRSAEVAGLVWDSTRSGPLAGAHVFLTDENVTTTTDRAGRFRLTGVTPGRHEVAFMHPRADSLGLPVSPKRVILSPNGARSVTLSIPRDAACPPGKTTTGLVGFVENVRTGEPVPGATLGAAPVEIGPEGPERPEPSAMREITADARGRYLVCGLPTGHTVALVPSDGSTTWVGLQAPGLRHKDVLTKEEAPAMASEPAPTRPSSRRGAPETAPVPVTFGVATARPRSLPSVAVAHEELRLGGVSATAAAAFKDEPKLLVDAAGRIYARTDHDVRIFAADGSVVKVVGREGDGPGELRHAYAAGTDTRPPPRLTDLYAVSPDGSAVITVTGEASQPGVATIRKFDPQGDTLVDVTLTPAQVPAPQAVADSVVADADHPAFREVVAGIDGSIWLHRMYFFADSTWVVLGPDGTVAFRVDLPADITVQQASLTHVWATAKGAYDAPLILRYAVEVEAPDPAPRR